MVPPTVKNLSSFLAGKISLSFFAMALLVNASDAFAKDPLSCSEIFESTSAIRGFKSRESGSSALQVAIHKTLELARVTSPPQVPLGLEIAIDPMKQSFLSMLYETRAVVANDLTFFVGDKLIATRALEVLLGERFAEFSPRALGLKEFLVKYRFVDSMGKLTASETEVVSAIRREFPNGVVMKPVEAEGSNGKGVIFDPEKIADLLIAKSVYQDGESLKNTLGALSHRLASGERYMLVSRIPLTILDEKRTNVQEFRVHVFDGRVVPNGISGRWNQWHDPIPPMKLKSVATKTQMLFDLLPPGFKNAQAYSLDVMLLPDGRIQVIEINSNHGKKDHVWSNFIGAPEILQGHIKLLEGHYGWKFTGLSGEILRGGVGNLRNFLKSDFLERIDHLNSSNFSKAEVLNDLVIHARKYVDPFLQMAHNSDPEQMSPEVLRTLRFAEKYNEHVKSIGRIGDSEWNRFVEWMKTLY